MTTSQLQEILKSNILLLSTSDGRDFSKHEEQLDAGAHILIAPPFEIMDETEEAQFEELLEIAGTRSFVAGQLLMPPVDEDDFDYDALYEQVFNQAKWLEEMGASLLFVNGCHDLVATKCALYAIREASLTMPVCAGITLPDEEASISKAISLLITLQALGVSAFGCSYMDLEASLSVLSELQAFTTVPLFCIAEPGSFLEPYVYADYVTSMVHYKCAMIGLNSDRTAYTSEAYKVIWQHMPLAPDFPMLNAICSQNVPMFLDFQGKIVSNQKQLIEIKTEKEDELEKILPIINKENAAPVCFYIRDIDLLEYAIMHYAGRPAVCSDEYGEITAKELGALILSEAPTQTPQNGEVE